jgi:SAM-dependent methyltransferase
VTAARNDAEWLAEQREQWNAAASMWRKWSEVVDSGAEHVSERLVELAAIKRGDRVLDVGTGLGEPALAAARRVGANGRVVASDISSAMLAFARERTAAAGLGNLDFVESDAASLDFQAADFDAALSRWAIIFEPEPEAAAARIRTFLKPGGRIAVSSWGPLDRVPMAGIPMRTIAERFGIEPPPEGAPGPFARPSPQALASLLEDSGFADVQVEDTQVTFEWESPEQFTTYVQEMSPRTVRLLASHPAAVRDEAWEAITEAVRAEAATLGRVRLSNQALLAVGRAYR